MGVKNATGREAVPVARKVRALRLLRAKQVHRPMVRAGRLAAGLRVRGRAGLKVGVRRSVLKLSPAIKGSLLLKVSDRGSLLKAGGRGKNRPRAILVPGARGLRRPPASLATETGLAAGAAPAVEGVPAGRHRIKTRAG